MSVTYHWCTDPGPGVRLHRCHQRFRCITCDNCGVVLPAPMGPLMRAWVAEQGWTGPVGCDEETYYEPPEEVVEVVVPARRTLSEPVQREAAASNYLAGMTVRCRCGTALEMVPRPSEPGHWLECPEHGREWTR